MQLSDMRTRAREIFGEPDENETHVSNTKLTGYANEFTRAVMTKLKVVPIKERNYVCSDSIALNANCLTINEAYILEQPANKYSPLAIVDVGDMLTIHPGWLSSDRDIPTHLVRTGTFVAVPWPLPNAANNGQTIKTFGMEFPDEMSADSELPDLPKNIQDLYPRWMAMRAFETLERPERAAEQLMIINSALKAQMGITTEFSRNRKQFRFTENED